MLLSYVLTYAGVAVFLVAVAARFVMFARMPKHLRWELYPVPHEGKRAAHGGSYLEEIDWWRRPRHVSHLSELKAMLTEILFLEALHRHNRPMWWRSFPFHFGLYLVIAATVLLGVGGAAPTLGGPCRSIAVVAGASGLGLSILGALGLLHRRLTAPDLADFTTAADLFNLVFFVVAFGVSFATFALFDRDFALLGRFVANVVTFRPEAVAGGAAGLMLALSASLLAVLLAYIPLTHMSHFVGKWFAYHSIRWNDEPNLQGGPHEPAIAHLLQQKVTWAAPHIQGGGKESWADLAGKTDYERSGK